MPKWKFIEDELIAATIRGALGRGYVYSDPQDTSNPKRKELQKSLTLLLRDLASQYANSVNDQQHKENIQRIAKELTGNFEKDGLLRENKFRIGTAQKALNLFLKYLWCLNKVPTPPHCPFDDRIIGKLPLSERQKKELKLKWTQLDSLDGYQTLVDAALKVKTDAYPSLSDWELEQWSK